MVEYSINKDEEKNIIRSLFMFMNFFQILISAFCFPLTIFFLMVGFLSDKEALRFAYPLLIIEVIMICIMIIRYFRIKNVISFKNKKYYKNGELKFLLKRENDLFINECISNRVVRSFLKEDIKKIREYKKVIIIMTTSNAVYVFPNSNQVKSILEM